MKLSITTLFTCLFSILIFAQDGNPTDYLSSDFHKSRRDAFREKMPENSVAVLFANPHSGKPTRSGSVNTAFMLGRSDHSNA